MMIVALTTEIIYKARGRYDHHRHLAKTRHMYLSAGMTTDKITRSDWSRIVIDKASLDVFACGPSELDVARIPSLAIDLFDAPSLVPNPGSSTLGGVALSVRLDHTVFDGIFRPPGLQELFLKLAKLHPSRFPDDRPKDIIVVLPLSPSKRPLLGGARDTSDGLINVDFLNPVVVSVVFDVKSDCSDRDGLSFQPADSLKAQNLVGGVTQCLVQIEFAADVEYRELVWTGDCHGWVDERAK